MNDSDNRRLVNGGIVISVIKSVLSYSAEHPEAVISIHVDEFEGIDIDINPEGRKGGK